MGHDSGNSQNKCIVVNLLGLVGQFHRFLFPDIGIGNAQALLLWYCAFARFQGTGFAEEIHTFPLVPI